MTQAELETLKGFDFETWPPGFEGDLYMALPDGTKVALGHPVSTTIAVTDGKIVAGHTRSVPAVAAQDLEIRQYDPTFYVQYTVQDISADETCDIRIDPYDPNAADRALAEQLQTTSDTEYAFELFEMGSFFADRIRLTCANS